MSRDLELCGNCTHCWMNALARATVNGGTDAYVPRTRHTGELYDNY